MTARDVIGFVHTWNIRTLLQIFGVNCTDKLEIYKEKALEKVPMGPRDNSAHDLDIFH